VREDLLVAECRRQRDGARAPLDGVFAALREHVQLRLIAVGHRQLAAGRGLFENLDRLRRALARLRVAAEEPVETRLPAEVVAFTDAIAGLAPQLHRLETPLQRLVELLGEVALVGERVEQTRALVERQRSRVLQCGAIVRGGLAMCARLCCFRGGEWGELQDRIGVACSGSMMGESRQRALSARCQAIENRAMHRDAAHV
jgi:hypothetical protein